MLYKVLKAFYEVIYFYFFSMAVIPMCYLFGDGITKIEVCED